MRHSKPVPHWPSANYGMQTVLKFKDKLKKKTRPASMRLSKPAVPN